MANIYETIKACVEKMELRDCEVICDESAKKISILLHDGENAFIKNNTQKIVQDFNLLAQLIAKKLGEPTVFVDVNNYRLERERIIVELAKAAARKALATKAEISLPAMNAYERRLVHMELSAHPEVKTESAGTGRDRYVTIKLLEETPKEINQEAKAEI